MEEQETTALTKEDITTILDRCKVTYKWFDFPEALILNIYNKSIDGSLFNTILAAMSADFYTIERTSEFIQIKKYK